MKAWLLMMVAAGVLVAGTAGAQVFTQPSADEIAKLVSGPSRIDSLIKDANPEQAADVLVKGIEAVDASTLKDEYKSQVIARLVAYAVVRMGSRAPEMMSFVVRRVTIQRLQLVTAAAIIAAPDFMNAMRKEIMAALGDDTDPGKLAEAAIKDPRLVLGELIYRLVATIASRKAITDRHADLHDIVPREPAGRYRQ